MAEQEKAIVQTFTSYVEAFQTLNPQAPLPNCHVPCVFIAPQGVLVMASIDEIEKFFTRVMEGLKARGYARSELTTLEVKQMSGDVALVSVSRARYKIDGQELQRVGETYTLRNTGQGWKIVVAMIHDPDTALHLA